MDDPQRGDVKMPWQDAYVLLAAKHLSVAVPGRAWNDFSDTDGFDAEVLQSVKLAFDGKTLIHPSQIVAAFAVLDHADDGVINLG